MKGRESMEPTPAEIAVLTCSDCLHDAIQNLKMILEDRVAGFQYFDPLTLSLINLKIQEAQKLIRTLA
jgi:hypothetical protein